MPDEQSICVGSDCQHFCIRVSRPAAAFLLAGRHVRRRLFVLSKIERLWTAPDGTFCVLTTDSAPPSYTLALMRGTEVLRERRLYGRATAQMLAIGWRGNR